MLPAGRLLGPADPETKAFEANTGRSESTQFRMTIGACGGHVESKFKEGTFKPGGGSRIVEERPSPSPEDIEG